MRPALASVFLLVGCVAHDEPELLVRFDPSGGTSPQVIVEGTRVHVFHDDVHFVDLATGEIGNLGGGIGGASRYDEVAVSEGWAYWLAYRWDAPDDVRIGRVAGGRDAEQIELSAPPSDLNAHGGCALLSTPPALYRWCPDDAAPVEVVADEIAGDVAADDEAYYYFAERGLIRLDAVTGERTELGAEGFPGAEIALDGDLVVWWEGLRVRAIPRQGGAEVVLGTLSISDGSPGRGLAVDVAGYHRGTWRLRRGEVVGEHWLSEVDGIVDISTGGGRTAWIARGVSDYLLYALPSGAAPPAPGGGEEGDLRPPYL